MTLEKPTPPPNAGPSRKRLLLILCIIAIGVVLAVTCPWLLRQSRCAVTVRPGQSIQEAIDAAEEGDVICLAEGKWSETLVIHESLFLVGSGTARTIIEAVLISGSVGLAADQDAAPITVRVEGLTFSGRGGGSAVEISGWAEAEIKDCAIVGQLYGVQVSDLASLTLSGSTVSDSPQQAVVVTGSARATIVGSRIQGNRRHGVWVSGSAQVTLVNSEVSENRGHGLWLQDQARVALTDCSVSGNGENGILLTEQSEVQLTRTKVSTNAGRGIMAQNGAKSEITDSKLLSNWHGVQLAGGARATITGSMLSLNRFDGITLQHSAFAVVSACVISANRRGMWIGGAGQAELRDCLIEENTGYGVFSSSDSDVVGGGNHFRANGIDLGGNLPGTLRLPLNEPRESVIVWPDARYTSLQEAADALVAGGRLILEPGEYTAALTIGQQLVIEAIHGQATLRGKSSALAVLSLVDGADLHLSRVAISGGAEGLLVSAGARIFVANSTVAQNVDGINLSNSASAELVDSCITGNDRRGIFVGDAAQATVITSLISNNGDSGIAATGSAQITITGSTIASNGGAGGIVVWGSPQAIIRQNTIAENAQFGVAIFQRPPFWESPWSFRGRISGSSNVLKDNARGSVSHPELGFLATPQGGELDLRS